MQLAEADFSTTQAAMGGNNVRYMDDDKLLVKFFIKARLNEGKTREEGHPIYEDSEYVQIMAPGNKNKIIIRPATPMDKNRFAEHYRKFKARMSEEEQVVGTPLTQWGAISPAQVQDLYHANIRTVEQLAGVADSNAQNILGIAGLKRRANEYLEVAKNTAVANEMLAMKEANAALQAQLAEMAGQLKSVLDVEPVEEVVKASRRRATKKD